MTHYIKIREEFADAVYSGDKHFEVRLNDRGYQKGDYVVFSVVDKNGFILDHKLNKCTYEITFVLSGWGIEKDHVVFNIERPNDLEIDPELL